MVGIGGSKQDFRTKLNDGKPDGRAVLVGDPLLENNVLVADASIMPGELGHDIPVIGNILAAVPGIPDFGSFETIHESTEEMVTRKEKVTFSSGYVATEALNPVAPDLTLTGEEYRQGRKAAKELFDSIQDPKKFEATSLIIEGRVSDEYKQKLGIGDPEQSQLGYDRAKVAAQAVRDEAAEREIELPVDILTTSSEAVLDGPVTQRINDIAGKQRISTEELLQKYNNGESLPDDIVKVLDEYLAANRGATINLEGTVEKTEVTNVIERRPVETKNFYDDLPGEGVFAFGAAAPLVYGLAFSGSGKRARSTQRKARRLAKKAGLRL